ncbi:MAG: phosphatase PAP2 family protein [Gammaproteobacteria bacterium]
MDFPESLLTLILLLAGMGGVLAVIAHYSTPPCNLDNLMLAKAFECRSDGLNLVFQVITLSGSLLILAPITVFIVSELNTAGRIGSALLLSLSLGGACLAAHLSKYAFKRKRPNSFPVIGENYQDYSFPSAHSAQITAFAGSLAHIGLSAQIPHYPWLIASGLLMVALVTSSRIYLQVHYPSDVLAGICLGVVWTAGVGLFLASVGIAVS